MRKPPTVHPRACVEAFSFEPPPPAIRGERSREVARRFGVDGLAAAASHHRRPRRALAAPSPGELMLIAGPSGSGKSSLLASLRRRARRAGTIIIDLRRVALPQLPVVELFADDDSLEPTLKRLARVGLAEVWSWLRLPSQLSEGQRWRLRLAITLARVEGSPAPVLLIADEFAAVLDRVTACIVSNVLRRAVDAHADRLAAIVATSHDDLDPALKADTTLTCDFGRVTVVKKERAR